MIILILSVASLLFEPNPITWASPDLLCTYLCVHSEVIAEFIVQEKCIGLGNADQWREHTPLGCIHKSDQVLKGVFLSTVQGRDLEHTPRERVYFGTVFV